MINRTKIDWCDYTWNPVWGCRNNCPYCYARRIAKRFSRRMYRKEFEYYYETHPLTNAYTGDHLSGLGDFKPTWLESNFQRKFPKKQSRIFVNSMSDIYFWKTGWMAKALMKIREHPQHTFIFLSKFPIVYNMVEFPTNCWLGISDTGKGDCIKHFHKSSFPSNKIFISFEPLLVPIIFMKWITVDWIIVGAETGNRKGKRIINKQEIDFMRDNCFRYQIPLFEKESLRPIMGNLIQEFPEVIKENKKG